MRFRELVETSIDETERRGPGNREIKQRRPAMMLSELIDRRRLCVAAAPAIPPGPGLPGSQLTLRWRRQSRANPSLKQAHVGGQLTRGARGYKNKLGNNPMRRPTEGNVRVAQERAMDV